MISKHQKRASLFSFLTAFALLFSQLLKGSFEYAPLIGFAAGLLFSCLALIMAIKACVQKKDN
ncbi:MAG: hypothetical protein ABRQ26_06390 [Syntrophomonadaceae bacterium]